MLVLLLSLSPSRTALGDDPENAPMCGLGRACAPHEICTVSLGECGSYAPYQICVGTCSAGLRWQIIPRIGGVAVGVRDVDFGGSPGLELIPPVAEGRVGLWGDWWIGAGRARTGVTAKWKINRGVHIGGVVSAVWPQYWAGTASVRMEWFPWWWSEFETFTAAHYFSIGVESGVLVDQISSAPVAHPFVVLGIDLWLLPPLPGRSYRYGRLE
jgi:hypothetical protein